MSLSLKFEQKHKHYSRLFWKKDRLFFILGVRINRILRLWMRKKNIFRKSSTNVPYRGYKVRGKIIPQ